MTYETKRPSKKVLANIIAWLAEQGIELMTGYCDIEEAIKMPGCMNINTVDEVISIYNNNQADNWRYDHGYGDGPQDEF